MLILTNVYTIIGLVLAIVIIVQQRYSIGVKIVILIGLWVLILMVERPEWVQLMWWKLRILLSAPSETGA